MRISLFIIGALLYLAACQQPSVEASNTAIKPAQRNASTFQTILDAANVTGAILIFDDNANAFLSNNFDWAKTGRLPASTFKITNSMIGLETGVVKDTTVFKWDRTPQRLPAWEKDLLLREAFHASCVPCYQQVARGIGADRMNEWLKKLDYGKMEVDSNSIDLFWLVGESKISQFQQIDFLKRLYYDKLPISEKTSKYMKEMIVMEANDRYKLSGKTGWAIRDGHNNGWFVGYLEQENKVYFFATNIDPKEDFDMSLFPKIRNEITMSAFESLGLKI